MRSYYERLYLNLPHYLNDLTFHFSAIDWKAPHKIKYSYFLEGLDEDWSEPKRDAKVDYQNLRHGEYSLKIKAVGEAQVWSQPFIYSFKMFVGKIFRNENCIRIVDLRQIPHF